MEEKQDADVDDVDRESLVKEIELIRRTLGSASTNSTRAHSDGRFGSFNINAETEKDSDDSEDELAIIKSPEYGKTSDESCRTQRIPVEIISSESEDEIEILTTKHTPLTTDDCSDFFSDGNVTYQISSIVVVNNSGNECERFEEHVSKKHDQASTSGQVPSSPEQFNSPLDKTNDSDEYTLTELQPAENNVQIPQGGYYQGSLDTADRNSNTGVAVLISDSAVSEDDRDKVSFSGEEEDDEITEQQRCLKLNRKYQAVIEAQLRNIEKLIAENRIQQLQIGEMSSSSSTTDEIELKYLASYSPYFKDTRKECPVDNEDTKLRKSLGQPHPFEKPPRPWSKEEKQILSDAVKSEILQAKLTPLLQRIETASQKCGRTNEDEKELTELRKRIDYIKTLPLLRLIEDFDDTIDFEDICNKMLPSRTAHQCQVFWYNELHPLLNSGKWTKDEDKLLLKLAEESTGGNWDTIACELMSNRSAVQCLQRYQRSLNKNFLKSRWEPEDDEKLKEAVRICGVGPWEKVASYLDGRTGSQCMHRYKKSVNPEIKRGKWEKEEDDLVRKGVELYGANWIKFRSLLPNRTGAQVRERWQDVLNPELRRDAWTKEEDEILLKVMQEQNVGLRNWSTIAKHVPGRTDNKCRRRWFILMKNDPKTKEHLSKQKITRAKLVNNFSRRRADKPSIGPEDFELSDLSETEENSSNTRLPDASANDRTPANFVASEDATAAKPNASENNIATKASAACKDGTAAKAGTPERPTSGKAVASKCPTSGKAGTPKGPTSGKAVASKCPTSGKAATPERPTSGKAVASKCPTSGQAGTPKGPTSGKAGTPKGPTSGKAVASKGPTSGKAVTPKVPTSGKAIASKGPTSGKAVAPKSPASGKAVASKDPISAEALASEDTAAVGNDSAAASADAKTAESNKGATPKTSKRKAAKKQRGKNTQTIEMQTGKQTANSKSPKTSSDVSSQDKQQKRKKVCTKTKTTGGRDKDPVPTPTTPSSSLATKVTSVSSEKASAERRKKTQKPKLTAPSPTVVSQASSLPNGIPISLLTQFSVLLQAFHVDVSGVLKNVSTQGEATTPQTKSRTVAGISSIPGQTPVSTVAPHTQSETATTDNSSVTNQVLSSSAATIQHQDSCVINTSSSTVTHATACTKQVDKSNNRSEEQPVSLTMSNENNSEITSSTTADTPESNSSRYSKGKITEKTMAEDTGATPRSRQVILIDDSDETSHNASGMKKSSVNTDTSSSSEATGKDNDTRLLRRKRKRDNTKDIDVVAEKRLNGKESEDDDNETGKSPQEKTDGVVLSDTRHGLNHDIVLAISPSHDGNIGADADATKTQNRTPKRKRDENRSTIVTKRARKRLNQSGSKGSLGDIECIEISPRRYPKRSTRGQSNVNDSTCVASTESKRTADNDVAEPLPASNINESDNNNSPSGSLNPEIGNNRYLHVKRVVMSSDVRLPQVPAIPLLPPSATTLSAFKKMLSLRKDLQSQATQLTNQATRETTDQPGTQNTQSSNQSTLTTTSLQNSCADRLLLVSNTEQTSHEEFRNSVAYQQLLNRFKGLFMWPGFLSIVNPSVGKSSEEPKKATRTPERKKGKYRRRTR